MKALKIAGAVIAFLLGGMCVTGTIVDLCSGKYGMTHPEFWGGIVFHALMGILGIFLLTKAIPYRPKAEIAGLSESHSIEEKIEQMFGDKDNGENV